MSRIRSKREDYRSRLSGKTKEITGLMVSHRVALWILGMRLSACMKFLFYTYYIHEYIILPIP